MRKTYRYSGKRLWRSIKAISPVIAVLLMIVIAVASSLVAYAWVMGYLGFTTSKVGNAVQIHGLATDNGNLAVYVQNVGQNIAEFTSDGSLYVNDRLTPILSIDNNPLEQGKTATIIADFPVTAGEPLKVKVVTVDGAFTESTNSKGASVPTSVTLTLNQPTGGSVTANPDQASYAYGITVELTATPETGYAFDSWSGHLSGSNNPETITMNGDKTITATFVQVFDHFGISVPASATAGQSFGGVTVTAYDAADNTMASYSGQVYFTSSDASATLPYTTSGKYTFIPGDMGVHTFTGFTLETAGLQTITLTDGSESITSDPINVNPGSLASFAFNTISSPQTAGTSFGITITAKDAYGNTVPSYAGTNSLSVSSGTISPTSTGTFSNGVRTLQVTLYTTGSGRTISTTGSSKTGTSNSITVNSGSGTFGYTSQGSSYQNIENRITGGQFTCTQPGTAQSIRAYIIVTGTHNIKAAIYTSSGSLVGYTEQRSITTSNDGWVTLNFGTKPNLSAGTTYTLVIWSNAASGDARLYYSTSGGTGRYNSRTYGSWPSSISFSSDGSRRYSIYCIYSIP